MISGTRLPLFVSKSGLWSVAGGTVLNAGGLKSQRNICTLRLAGGLMNGWDNGCHRWIGGVVGWIQRPVEPRGRLNRGEAGWIEGLVLSSLRAGWISESLLIPPTGFEQFVTDSVTR
ncbi:hypothetical protein NG798_26355 [Ancylothrix sp. C2]|uniref:hypothetical protein n=1 Tax=Ancylothrix sp. D3o TaxID=2953691 RepID=UPI0021BAADF3|nr:hypothetical protein [Ancylothrix sp. D3o]MCT7953326.1 hypothetical protein [Ancylothrix sp. D3o]